MWVCEQRHAPAALLPGKTQYPLYRRLGGPQSRSGRLPKISLAPVFDPRIVQSVKSRYTDCAILAKVELFIYKYKSISVELNYLRVTVVSWPVSLLIMLVCDGSLCSCIR